MDFEPWAVMIRTVASFAILVILTRIMGKQTIAQMTYLDFITSLILGNIGASIAYHVDINPLNIIFSLIIFVAIAYLISYVSLKSQTIRKIFVGQPTVLIQNGKILEQNMAKIRYSLDSLNHQLREKGFYDISQVEMAILEPNGHLSILPKSQFRPLTPSDLKIPVQNSGFAIELVMDGKVMDENITENNLSRQWLNTTLALRGITDIKDVNYACLSSNGTLYLDVKKDKIANPLDKE